MDYHSVTDPNFPAWVKSDMHGTESLFECDDGCSSMNLPMGDQQNQQFRENEYSNPNPIDVNMDTNPEYKDPNPTDVKMIDMPNPSYGVVPVTEELLWPVAPFSTGEGLPYAPVDWPNPGDLWKWRVGRRVNNAGYFVDRFLYPPKHLIPPGGGPKFFAGKTSLESFFETHMPSLDVGAFFASFSWKIPAKIQTPKKVKTSLVQLEETSQDKTDTVQQDKEERTPRYSRRERKQQIEKVEAQEEDDMEGDAKALHSTRMKRKQISLMPSSTPKEEKEKEKVEAQEEDDMEGDAKALHSTRRKRKQISLMPSSTPKETAKKPSKRSTRSATKRTEEQQEATVDLIPEGFDEYLDSLEDILTQPLSEALIYDTPRIEISLPANEMVKARYKLSSLLLKDLPSLMLSRNFSQVMTLASKLRKDPTLTADQLVKLKLIEELPLFSEVYSESRQTINQVHKFFATLEANKTKVASMKNEYSELKEKADQLQTELDSSVVAVQEIDDQIAELEAHKVEFMKSVETSKDAKLEVSFAQRMVASSIPNVVQEIQVANSRIPEMDLKRANAEKREAEILEKFAPLQGFSF